MNPTLEDLSVQTADTIYDSAGADAVLDVVAIMLSQFGDRMIRDQGPLAAATFLAQVYVTVGILGKATAALLTQAETEAAVAAVKGQIN